MICTTYSSEPNIHDGSTTVFRCAVQRGDAEQGLTIRFSLANLRLISQEGYHTLRYLHSGIETLERIEIILYRVDDAPTDAIGPQALDEQFDGRVTRVRVRDESQST